MPDGIDEQFPRDPESPLLIGHVNADDKIHEAVQTSWIDPQMRLPLF